MPEIDHLDGDGAPIYAEPAYVDEPEWDPKGDPHRINLKALCAAVANEILGCRPRWWGYYCDWTCSCDDNDHGCDQQCSSIANPDQMLSRVVAACDRRGIALLARPSATDMLRDALAAWRAA